MNYNIKHGNMASRADIPSYTVTDNLPAYFALYRRFYPGYFPGTSNDILRPL
ncbi:MAG: hypothetical protein R3F11_06390 [Verrucomicrobiales bacterium]